MTDEFPAPFTTSAAPGGDDILVRVENLVKYFPVRTAGFFRRTVGNVQAVDGVSLAIPRGKTLGLVGETGCGKSTLARCVAGLLPVTSGKVIFDGHDITNLSRRRMQPFRREIQMIFQDPYGSLNPRRRVGVDHRRPVRHPQDRHRRRAQAHGAGTDGAGRAQPRALQPVPGRVLRRPAAADRRGAGARAAAQADHLRRAGLGAGRVDPGAGPQPAGRPAARLRAHLPVHRARPGGRAARQRRGHGHVPGPGRRDPGRGNSCTTRPGTLTQRRCCRQRRPPIRTRRRAGSGSSSPATYPHRSTRPPAAGSIRGARRRRSCAVSRTRR